MVGLSKLDSSRHQRPLWPFEKLASAGARYQTGPTYDIAVGTEKAKSKNRDGYNLSYLRDSRNRSQVRDLGQLVPV